MLNKQKPKIGFYSPYLSMFGGGERYLLSIAKSLSDDFEVSLFGPIEIKKEAERLFGLDLEKIKFTDDAVFRRKSLLNKTFKLTAYNKFFYMTDGSLFFSPLKENFLIIQSPAHIPKLNLLNKIKLRDWKILCYSRFMADIIFSKLERQAYILPPPIDIPAFEKKEKKENLILTVGRFFPYPHNKKQDMLLAIFKKYYQKVFKDWHFVIAGGLKEEGGRKIVEELQKESKGYPVEVQVNLPFSKLCRLYAKAKIYWHSAGFEEDLVRYPERAEHFGITTLEAMASACVPVVFAGGGQIEIVESGENGFLWQNEKELVEKTKKLQDVDCYTKMSRQAQKRATDYSFKNFNEKLEKIIHG